MADDVPRGGSHLIPGGLDTWGNTHTLSAHWPLELPLHGPGVLIRGLHRVLEQRARSQIARSPSRLASRGPMTTVPLVIGCGVVGLAVGSLLTVLIGRELRSEGVATTLGARPHRRNPNPSIDDPRVSRRPRPRGGCRGSTGPAGARNILVVTGTGILFAVTAAHFGPVWHLPAFLYMAAAGVALAVIDLDAKRLPNSIVLPCYVVGGVLLAAASLMQGDPTAVLRAAVGGVGMLAGYAAMALLQPNGMGGGDVKLSGVLGMYLAWLGWPQFLLGWFAAFLLGAVVGLGLLVSKRAGRASTIPFGPFMLIGAVAGVALGGWIGA